MQFLYFGYVGFTWFYRIPWISWKWQGSSGEAGDAERWSHEHSQTSLADALAPIPSKIQVRYESAWNWIHSQLCRVIFGYMIYVWLFLWLCVVWMCVCSYSELCLPFTSTFFSYTDILSWQSDIGSKNLEIRIDKGDKGVLPHYFQRIIPCIFWGLASSSGKSMTMATCHHHTGLRPGQLFSLFFFWTCPTSKTCHIGRGVQQEGYGELLCKEGGVRTGV